MAVKVLWFSRHDLDEDQMNSLEKKYGEDADIIISTVDKTIEHASDIQNEIDWADVIAIVAPTELQAEFKKLAGDKPVIFAKSKRILHKDANGKETKVEFKFDGWFEIKKLEYEVVPYSD